MGDANVLATPVRIDSGSHDDRAIGRILLDAGLLNAEGAEKALRMHQAQNIRFGEACVRLGLVSEGDIQAALSSQFHYPYLRPGEGNLSTNLVAAYEPFSQQVETFRALRAQLLLRWFNADRKVLSVASGGRGDGRSFLAANLAIVFSQLGERTLLIDADLRAPMQHQWFNLPNKDGLSAVLGSRATASIIQPVPAFQNLSVAVSGPLPPNPLELVTRPDFKHFINAMQSTFDVILVDSPAASWGADSQTIASSCGGAVAVVREGKTRARNAQDLIRSILEAHATVVGSVVNKR